MPLRENYVGSIANGAVQVFLTFDTQTHTGLSVRTVSTLQSGTVTVRLDWLDGTPQTVIACPPGTHITTLPATATLDNMAAYSLGYVV